MRLFTRFFFFIMLLLSLAGCKKNLGPEDLPSHVVMGNNYYTQFVIRYVNNAHRTTNYRRGDSLAVNTYVKLVGINKRMITIELVESGQKIIINNIPKHTKRDIYSIFERYLARNEVDLSRFNSLETKHIKEGTVAVGMSKVAVTVAIGYPPATKTVGLEANTWIYWSRTFKQFNVEFSDDKVVKIVD